MKITYRTGEKKDCLELARLIYVSSDGIVDYMLDGLIPGVEPILLIAGNHEKNDSHHTYENAIVATQDDIVAGAAISFPSVYHKITNQMRRFFPAQRLEHLNDFYSSRVENTLFLSSLCVFEKYRNNGVGETLIELTQRKAVESGFKALSLMVFKNNHLALPIYQRIGFKIVKRVELKPNGFIKYQGGCLLMTCECS